MNKRDTHKVITRGAKVSTRANGQSFYTPFALIREPIFWGLINFTFKYVIIDWTKLGHPSLVWYQRLGTMFEAENYGSAHDAFMALDKCIDAHFNSMEYEEQIKVVEEYNITM